MNKNFENRANALASQNYSVVVILDDTTEGEPVYFAQTPEFDGCFGQGKTISEAVDNLYEARIDYIRSLLEDNMPVPGPSLTTTSAKLTTTVTISYHQSDTFNVKPTTQQSDTPNQPLRLFEGVIRV